jgi:large repetitive protein
MASVAVTVYSINDTPIAVDDSVETDEDNAVIVSVLDNDIDADIDVLSITMATNGANGMTTVNPDGTITYTPNANFYGTDSFDYTISDGNGGTATASVAVTVNLVNSLPLAVDDSFMTDEDNPVMGNLFADNGSGADSDPDGDSFSVSAVNGSAVNVGASIVLGSGALLVVNADGSFSYDPTAALDYLADGESFMESFTYTIDDGNGGTATATAALTTTGLDPEPVGGTPITLDFEGLPTGNLNTFNTLDFSGLTVKSSGALEGSQLGQTDRKGDFSIAALDQDFDFCGGLFSSSSGATRNIDIEAYDDGVLVDSYSFTVSGGATVDVTLDFASIDELVVNADGKIYVDDLVFLI